jgi:uncharacterized protein YhbP (UPF0306 family)
MPEDHPEITQLLSLSTLTLATRREDGQPHAAPVYFAADPDLRLYFFSSPNSQHIKDISQDRRAGAAVYPDGLGWQDIRGLQMRGVVEEVSPGLEWDRAWELYQSKFPFVAVLKEEVAQNTLYVFIPRWIRLVDNRKGFGFNQEWDLD